MGHAIVENNQFIGMDPTAYQNIAGWGCNIYSHTIARKACSYIRPTTRSRSTPRRRLSRRNRRKQGTELTLAADPTYPNWGEERASGGARSFAYCPAAGRPMAHVTEQSGTQMENRPASLMSPTKPP